MLNFGYQLHTSFTTPSDDTVVYHSIHLEYLRKSIKNAQLRFASVLSYKDSFEGKLPYPNEVSTGEWFISITDEGPVFGPYETISKVLCDKILRGNIPPKTYPLKYFFDEWSNYIFSHCWSLNLNPWNENPSNAIITIQSTIGNIKKAFCGDYCYHIGSLKYINYLTEGLPAFTKLLAGRELSADLLYERHLHKRLKYKKEEEVRLIISWESFIREHSEVKRILPQNPYNQEAEPEKLYREDYVDYKRVDFSKLIDAILIQRDITKEQLESLHSVLAEANINVPVKQLSDNG